MKKTLRLKNDLSELRKMAGEVEAFGNELRLSHKMMYRLQLSLEEIVVNVISYGYDDGEAHEILVEISGENDFIIAEVRDDARPFNPKEAAPVSLDIPFDEREPGGLGIHLVRHYADKMEYKREGGENILRMEWKISSD